MTARPAAGWRSVRVALRLADHRDMELLAEARGVALETIAQYLLLEALRRHLSLRDRA